MALITLAVNDGYVDKLAKLVPAEAISAYMALIAVAGVSEEQASEAISNATAAVSSPVTSEVWAAFGIAFIILIIARILGSVELDTKSKIDISKIDWIMVAITIIAYCFWVYTIGADTSGPFQEHYSVFWGTAMITLFTFLAPYFYNAGSRVIRGVSG